MRPPRFHYQRLRRTTDITLLPSSISTALTMLRPTSEDPNNFRESTSLSDTKRLLLRIDPYHRLTPFRPQSPLPTSRKGTQKSSLKADWTENLMESKSGTQKYCRRVEAMPTGTQKVIPRVVRRPRAHYSEQQTSSGLLFWYHKAA
jgi:hypothetical protein